LTTPTQEVGIPPLPPSGVAAWIPGLWVAKHYRRGWLLRDVSAGLVLTALLVPAGMGYAQAAGLPAVNGLYATIGPLLAYAAFGPSRIMVLGPDSALAAMIGAAVATKAADDPARAGSLASVLAIMTGVLCLVAAAARGGIVAELLSKPVRVGYMNGIGLTVLVTQLPKLFGFSVRAPNLTGAALELVRGVAAGRTQPSALALGTGALALIVGGSRLAPKVPWLLVALAASTFIVTALGLGGQVAVVGAVPFGLPVPALPSARLEELPDLLVAAVGIALVSFADTSVLSRAFSGKNRHRVDPNRELVGLGAANLAAGLIRGFPISSSASRTPVAESAGARTQLTGVVGALAMVLLLVAAPWLTKNVPVTALAAVVISAAVRMFDVASMRAFHRVRRSDFALSLVAFFAVAGLGVLPGIGVAVAVSLLDVVRRAWRPHDAILGQAEGVKGYHDLRRYPAAKQIPGLLLYRWDAPLFFANADTFRERILDAVEGASSPVQWVVVAAEPITDVDTTAAEMLEELDKELGSYGAELAFAELKDPVRDRLERYGLRARIGHGFFFPTVGVAVKAFLARHDIDGADWEEAQQD
jgi:high affinity sulfate transporter 1